jgi:hypothetical protein
MQEIAARTSNFEENSHLKSISRVTDTVSGLKFVFFFDSRGTWLIFVLFEFMII